MDSQLLKTQYLKTKFCPAMNEVVHGSTPNSTQKPSTPPKKTPVSRLNDYISNIVFLAIKNHLEQNRKSDLLSPLPSAEVVQLSFSFPDQNSVDINPTKTAVEIPGSHS